MLEKYETHHAAIHHLLSSILACFNHKELFEQSPKELRYFLTSLCNYYPFVSILYLLDKEGRQKCKNIQGQKFKRLSRRGEGIDRSKRPYFLSTMKTEGPVITGPYLSNAGRKLCLSASTKIYDDQGELQGYLVLDIDLDSALNFLTGENRRAYFEPFFKIVYSTIVIGLFVASFFLIYVSYIDSFNFFRAIIKNKDFDFPFGIIIYLTLALAIFDLAKTILEEEVLFYKDLSQNSSTRRTITRFIAAIIIAMSIEALLMVFKSALHRQEDDMIAAVWVILATSALLGGLAIYTYLGSKAEVLLDQLNKTETKKQPPFSSNDK
jgi:hypothetical protein